MDTITIFLPIPGDPAIFPSIRDLPTFIDGLYRRILGPLPGWQRLPQLLGRCGQESGHDDRRD